jgi:SAM-dependent methyltransferase
MMAASAHDSSVARFPTVRARQSWLRHLIDSQVHLTRRFDGLLPAEFQVDGNRDFLDNLVPMYLKPGSLVYDVGGGKNPVIGRQLKTSLRLRVVGLDVDSSELAGAPPGLYDQTICADISTYAGCGDADLVVCQALLEHVRDADRAIAAISSILKPGGRAMIFVPSRNALYARLNLILPQRIKRRILYAVFPEMRKDHGFPAYYDRCTPAAFDRLGRRHGLIPESRRLYFTSGYFRFCLPLHVVWRVWLILFRWMAGDEAAETFAVIFRKEQSKLWQPQPSFSA